MGGGAASSMTAGSNASELDFNAVQRADAEMARRCECVTRACLEIDSEMIQGTNSKFSSKLNVPVAKSICNPILSIHDQGAGGSGNVLKEIADPTGCRITLDRMTIGDKTMNPL